MCCMVRIISPESAAVRLECGAHRALNASLVILGELRPTNLAKRGSTCCMAEGCDKNRAKIACCLCSGLAKDHLAQLGVRCSLRVPRI